MPTAESLTVLDLIWNAGPIAKLVLAVLAIFSVFSWALIVSKWWQFRRVRRQTLAFLKVFRDARRPAIVEGAARRFRESPLARLWAAAHAELAGVPEVVASPVLDEGDDGLATERLEAVNRAMRRAAGDEIAQLEEHLTFLATTASATPFIGLFGTVWGVMSAFHGIGTQGSASLAVVAPGISEALIATAAGLGAAIPAVIGYNYFVNRVKHWATEMEGFTLDLLNALSRPAPKATRPGRDGV